MQQRLGKKDHRSKTQRRILQMHFSDMEQKSSGKEAKEPKFF